MDEISHKSFNELGIDVGMDSNQNIWLYEVNWRPSLPPVYYLELDAAKYSIHYAIYLANKHKSMKATGLTNDD
ncbi:YheC/YheD family protein [Paenactinomyces guangxiensis]|uniref:YheC/YheD family protein n=1 Tax=Paenactinomyces guangxiensis TaxID=1490290 RepID=UPI001E44E599|nr:YheC/YheD family protein [Paenactinomyces guangxiensis]